MKAAIFYNPGDLRIEDIEKPIPGPGEIVVKNFNTLTCGTDLKTYLRGHPLAKPPKILGHEFAGTVYDVGEGVTSVKRGDRVVSFISAPCYSCYFCKLGQYTLCENLANSILGLSIDGAYAEYVKLPENIVKYNLYKVPNDLQLDEAALLEPFACVVRGFRKVMVDIGDIVVVLGAGPIGLMHMMLSKQSNSEKVIIIDISWDRLKIAERLGADVIVNSVEEDPIRRIKEETDGMGADVVIEAVGKVDTWETAMKLVRKGGRVLFFGGAPKNSTFSVDTFQVHYEEVGLLGTFHSSPEDVLRTFKIIKSRKLPLRQLITNKAKLEDIHQVFGRLKEGKEIKVAITF